MKRTKSKKVAIICEVPSRKRTARMAKVVRGMFVPNESTKDGKNKSAITKGTKWAEMRR